MAQSSAPVAYTDSKTGIVFDTWTVPQSDTKGGLTFGVALPSDALTVDATEFIGYLVRCFQPYSFLGPQLTLSAMRRHQRHRVGMVRLIPRGWHDQQPPVGGLAV